MKRLRWVLLGLPLMASCAKFPDQGTIADSTRVTFTLRVANHINTTLDGDPSVYYIYDIAIRATPDLNPPDIYAPQLVANQDNPNGRVAGSPTHFVEFDSLNPNSSEPFVLYRFSTQLEVPNPSDPSNPINLASYARSTRGRIVNYRRLDENTSELKFDIFVNQLADTDDAAKLLNTLQVNFLTMNRLSTGSGGTRVIDAIGDTTGSNPDQFNRYIKVDLRQSGIINNTTGVTANIEPTGDTVPFSDPDLDIVDWSIEVTKP